MYVAVAIAGQMQLDVVECRLLENTVVLMHNLSLYVYKLITGAAVTRSVLAAAKTLRHAEQNCILAHANINHYRPASTHQRDVNHFPVLPNQATRVKSAERAASTDAGVERLKTAPDGSSETA